MQFRCYACGFKFSDGPPPLEALSEAQSAVVGVSTGFEHVSLWGTPYEGLSTYNFCSFCLTMIRDFPLAQFNKSCVPGHKMEWKQDTKHWSWRAVKCECGAYNMLHRNGSTWSGTEDVLLNRWMVLHLAAQLYPNSNLSEVISLSLDDIVPNTNRNGKATS